VRKAIRLSFVRKRRSRAIHLAEAHAGRVRTKVTCLLTRSERSQKPLVSLNRPAQNSRGFSVHLVEAAREWGETIQDGAATVPETDRTRARFRTIQDFPKDIRVRQGHC
jgi:hypothetical protein